MSIRISNLKKSFFGTPVFNIPSLELREGFTCIFGPSGCGKTTLGRIISGLDKADSGIIEGVIGQPTVLFQESRLLPSVSAIENVKCVSSSDKSYESAISYLKTMGFSDDDMKKLPHELSGGMARRVAIARALLFASENGGNFVLLDEPFNGIDKEMRAVVASLIKEALTDKTVLVITHDEGDAELLSGSYLSFEVFSK